MKISSEKAKFYQQDIYYRKFIEKYAAISKPLTKHLHGENGKISQYLSKRKIIHLDLERVVACETLKHLLSQQVEPTQVEKKKCFNYLCIKFSFRCCVITAR